jgi:hypothetical protein
MRWLPLALLLSCGSGTVDLAGEAEADADTDADTDADSDADADTAPAVDCGAFTVAECKAEPACRVLKAFAVLELGEGSYCVDDSSVEVGCAGADESCPPYTTWGAASESPSSCYSFGDCQPEGWGACADPSMRTTIPCG